MKNVLLELTRIIENSGLAESPARQVQVIVDSVSSVIQMDVCSLYRRSADGDMALIASHGLRTKQPVVIPFGQGLVGVVVQSRHVQNIADASDHPDFYYLPETREERYRSFCGVPLVKKGEVIGVLVVQSKRANKLKAEQEAFLSTLAAHLALLIDNIPLGPGKSANENIRIAGVSGATGVAIAIVRFSKGALLSDVADTVIEDIDAEMAQWHKVLADASADLDAEQASLDADLKPEFSGVFDAYKMLLADPALLQHVEAEIRAGFAIPTALKKSIHYIVELFRAMQDPYLQARCDDFQHLGNKLYQVWLGRTDQYSLGLLQQNEPYILMGSQIGVSDIVNLPADKLSGIVCFDGAALSHIAVLANALGIPAVMGVGELKDLAEGMTVIVDGNTGVVVHHPTDLLLKEYKALMAGDARLEKRLRELRDLPATTLDQITIRLLVNSGLQADIMPGLRNGAEGVGLYRTEIPFMIRDSLPSEQSQLTVYKTICSAYSDKPVYIRTLDIGSDKPLPYLPAVKEENPALGWRGIRFSLDNIQLLVTQLRAILRAAEAKPNVHILMPMVSSTFEIDRFNELVDDCCRELCKEGHMVIRPPVGMMVEIPGVISMLPLWRKRLDFVSIGSNDLSQFLLALDRNNALVSKHYDPLHPAIVHELKRTISTANELQLPVTLCGELASDPVAVLLLIGMGLRSLSLSSARLPMIKWVIRSVSTTTAIQFLDQALTMDEAASIRDLGNRILLEHGLDQAIRHGVARA